VTPRTGCVGLTAIEGQIYRAVMAAA